MLIHSKMWLAAVVMLGGGCVAHQQVVGTYVAHVYRDGDVISADICDLDAGRNTYPDPSTCHVEIVGPRVGAVAPPKSAGFAAIHRAALACAAELHVTGVARVEVLIDRDHRVPRVDSDRGGQPFVDCVSHDVARFQFDDVAPQTVTIPIDLAPHV